MSNVLKYGIIAMIHDFNEQTQAAGKVLENGTDHLLIVGRAGTGKSTLLNYFRENTKRKIAVIAPTGVAALNVRGETIHSFFKLRPGSGETDIRNGFRRMKASTLEIYTKLDCLVIDEISMVRADLFDQIDLFLRLARKNSNPFGGVRMIMFGDLYQLPPVVRDDEWGELRLIYDSPYFFSSKVWSTMEGDLFGPQIDLIELKEIYRQKDPVFINFLNSVRDKNIDVDVLNEINSKLVDESIDISASEHRDAVVLTTTNRKAEMINQMQMREIEAETIRFTGKSHGKFDQKNYPTEIDLQLKRGARIMLLNNDSEKRWINGSTGWVQDIVKDAESGDLGIVANLDDGQIVEVGPYNWEMAKSVYNAGKGEIEREVIGSFKQLPVKLAWAITIHKSQGKTFDKVILDLDRAAFATGQTYVALSRCTSLQGLKLIRPLREDDILLDEKIVTFLNHLEFILGKSEKEGGMMAGSPRERKRDALEKAVADKTQIEVIYLGSGNLRAKRMITPIKIAPMTHLGQTFTAVTAFCHQTEQKRVFNFDRILEVLSMEDESGSTIH